MTLLFIYFFDNFQVNLTRLLARNETSAYNPATYINHMHRKFDNTEWYDKLTNQLEVKVSPSGGHEYLETSILSLPLLLPSM